MSAAIAHPTGWHGGFPTGRPWAFASRTPGAFVGVVRVANPSAGVRASSRVPDPGPRIRRLSPSGVPEIPLGTSYSLGVPALRRWCPGALSFGVHALPRLPAGCGALGPTRFACRGSLTPRCDASRAATLTRIVDWAFFAPVRFGWPNPRGHRRADRGVNSARPVKVTQPTPMSLAADSRRART